MKSTIFLVASDIPELVRGADPAQVASMHPLWARSVAYWAPWSGDTQLRITAPPESSPLLVQGWTAAWTGPGNVFVCPDCVSALDVAWLLMRAGLLSEGDAVMAVTQSAGRGQIRRPWQSLPGNLHAVWRTPLLSRHWDGLSSLIPAWLTARTLKRLGWDVRLKWPNDLVCMGRKIGGILMEQRGEAAMVGLGLNLAATPDSGTLRNGATLPAGSMDGRMCPAKCWDELVFDRQSWYLDHLPILRPEFFAEAFSQDLLWKGQSVIVTEHAGAAGGVQGIVLGVAKDGSLMLSAGGQVRLVTSGDIRLVT